MQEDWILWKEKSLSYNPQGILHIYITKIVF